VFDTSSSVANGDVHNVFRALRQALTTIGDRLSDDLVDISLRTPVIRCKAVGSIDTAPTLEKDNFT